MPAGGGDAGAAPWVVYLDGDGDFEDAMAELDAITLSPRLFILRSDLTQTRLYHLVKRRTEPTSLFVGRLADPPKFKGMMSGALATLRAWKEPVE